MATEVSRLIDEGIARLQRVTDQPRHEAEILLAAALGRTRAWIMAHPEERILDCDATDRYEAYVTRRSHGEPVAYVLGEKEFWSLPLAVTPDVLIPRPETELVVELALTHLPRDAQVRVLDLATGSGAIALAIAHERPRATVVGTDISAAAISVARRNASHLRLGNVAFAVGSWFDPVAGQRFDLIAGNPPYIAEGDDRVEPGVRRFEPKGALFSGPDGLAALRVIAESAGSHLAAGGWLIMEHGDRQGSAVRALLATAGFGDVTTHRDLAGLERAPWAAGREAPGRDIKPPPVHYAHPLPFHFLQAGHAAMIRFETSLGAFTIELFDKEAPVTVQNFLDYVDAGHFDGTVFHRVIPGFVVQGGGMTEDMKQKSTRAPIKNEADNGVKNRRGTLSMARTNDPHSATSQFFINLVDNSNLDPGRGSAGYAVFGCVADGMSVIDAMAKVKTGRRGMHDDVPVEPIKVISAKRVEAAK